MEAVWQPSRCERRTGSLRREVAVEGTTSRALQAQLLATANVLAVTSHYTAWWNFAPSADGPQTGINPAVQRLRISCIRETPVFFLTDEFVDPAPLSGARSLSGPRGGTPRTWYRVRASSAGGARTQRRLPDPVRRVGGSA